MMSRYALDCGGVASVENVISSARNSAEGRPRKVPARIAGAGRVHRPRVLLILRLFDDNSARRRKQVSVTRVTRGKTQSIMSIPRATYSEAPPHPTPITNAACLSKQPCRNLRHLQTQRPRLADGKAPDRHTHPHPTRSASPRNAAEDPHTSTPARSENSTLRLLFPKMRVSLPSPPNRPLRRNPSRFVTSRILQTLIEHHHDVAAQRQTAHRWSTPA